MFPIRGLAIVGVLVLRWIFKMKWILLVNLFLFSQFTMAFDCQEIVNKKYYTPGDSDFQFQYSFKEKGKVELEVFMTSHDVKDSKMEIEKYVGSYKVEKNKMYLDIKVDENKHKITFSCLDSEQYMGVGPKSKTLKPIKSKPANHTFSFLSLWPEGSPVIRKILKEKK